MITVPDTFSSAKGLGFGVDAVSGYLTGEGAGYIASRGAAITEDLAADVGVNTIDVAPSATFLENGASRMPSPFLARTANLPETASLGEVLNNGWIPGRQGITLTDGTIRFGDVYRLTQDTGIEFGLTRETVNGQYVRRLYSGGVDAIDLPTGTNVSIYGHTHPSGNAFPGIGDMNSINSQFLRSIEANPYAPVPHQRIIWGTGNLDNTIYYPSVLR